MDTCTMLSTSFRLVFARRFLCGAIYSSHCTKEKGVSLYSGHSSKVPAEYYWTEY